MVLTVHRAQFNEYVEHKALAGRVSHPWLSGARCLEVLRERRPREHGEGDARAERLHQRAELRPSRANRGDRATIRGQV